MLTLQLQGLLPFLRIPQLHTHILKPLPDLSYLLLLALHLPPQLLYLPLLPYQHIPLPPLTHQLPVHHLYLLRRPPLLLHLLHLLQRLLQSYLQILIQYAHLVELPTHLLQNLVILLHRGVLGRRLLVKELLHPVSLGLREGRTLGQLLCVLHLELLVLPLRVIPLDARELFWRKTGETGGGGFLEGEEVGSEGVRRFGVRVGLLSGFLCDA